jgi:hypothetical protein
VIGALDGGLRGEPRLGTAAVHVDKRCRVAEVDDNGGARANVSCQRPREPPIVPYLVHACHSVLSKLERGLSMSLRGTPAFRSGQSQMKCVPSISGHGCSTRCRTALTRRERSASAKQERARMDSLGRPIRRIHSPPSIEGSTRSRNSTLKWGDHAGSPVPAVANTPRKQRDCAAPYCSPPQTSFCERASSRSFLRCVCELRCHRPRRVVG